MQSCGSPGSEFETNAPGNVPVLPNGKSAPASYTCLPVIN